MGKRGFGCQKHIVRAGSLGRRQSQLQKTDRIMWLHGEQGPQRNQRHVKFCPLSSEEGRAICDAIKDFPLKWLKWEKGKLGYLDISWGWPPPSMMSANEPSLCSCWWDGMRESKEWGFIRDVWLSRVMVGRPGTGSASVRCLHDTVIPDPFLPLFLDSALSVLALRWTLLSVNVIGQKLSDCSWNRVQHYCLGREMRKALLFS